LLLPQLPKKVQLFFKNIFVGVPHLATYIFLNFQTDPELGAEIDPGMSFTPSPSSILDEMIFEPTT
jgi:hypothetical protein